MLSSPATPTVRFAPPAIGADEIAEVVSALNSGWLSTGPRVHQFERAFAAYVGAPHAVAVNSGTAALHLALLATGVGSGDDVVTTPLTFCATANVVIHAGATPRFADVDPITWNLTAESAAAGLTKNTRHHPGALCRASGERRGVPASGAAHGHRPHRRRRACG